LRRKPTSHAKIKLDRRNRRAIFHLALKKGVNIYKPENIVKPVNVNENSVAIIYEAFATILETDLAKATGSGSRKARKAMEKLKEGKKRDYRWKIADLIVKGAMRIREDEKSNSY
jgi:hypothetical protein